MSISSKIQKNLASAHHSSLQLRCISHRINKALNFLRETMFLKMMLTLGCFFVSFSHSYSEKWGEFKLIPALISSYLQLWPLVSLLQVLNFLSGPLCHFLSYQFFPDSCSLNKVTEDNTFTVLKKIREYRCPGWVFSSLKVSVAF